MLKLPTRRGERGARELTVWNLVSPLAVQTSGAKKSAAAHSPHVALMNALHGTAGREQA